MPAPRGSGPAARTGLEARSERRPDPLARALLVLVRAYRVALSPLLGPRCRFHPTCSAYAADALVAHGAWRGTRLAAWRVARCQPFSDGGYDPVPPAGAPEREDVPC